MEQATELVKTPALTGSRRWRSGARALAEVVLPPVITFALLLGTWEVIVVVREVSPIILPRPSVILTRLVKDYEYFFLENGMVTFKEALLGFGLGALVALVAAAVMARFRWVERSFLPLVVLIKATPIVVIAPLLIVWWGYGEIPKVILAALLCFFPILVNTIIGLRSVSPTSLELFESLAASEWETFTRLRVPHALPYVISAFKTAVSLAVIGAVVAEWAGAGAGLGRVVFLKAAQLDQAAVFASVFVLAAMGISLTWLVNWLEKRLLFWHESAIVD
jgi:ABC-type nitrate/sulfonate/bicarbonate transport system permease component